MQITHLNHTTLASTQKKTVCFVILYDLMLFIKMDTKDTKEWDILNSKGTVSSCSLCVTRK